MKSILGKKKKKNRKKKDKITRNIFIYLQACAMFVCKKYGYRRFGVSCPYIVDWDRFTSLDLHLHCTFISPENPQIYRVRLHKKRRLSLCHREKCMKIDLV